MPAASAVGAVEYFEALSARDQEIQQRLAKVLTALGPSFAEARQISALSQTRTDRPRGVLGALRDAVYEAYYTTRRSGR